MIVKKILLIMGFILCTIYLSACSGSDMLDQIENYSDKDNKYVLSIKNAIPSGQVKTFGEAFDDFFSSPTWKHFDADTGETVVEFTGYCTYMDKKVKATMQFKINISTGMYEISYLDINDIPQNQVMLQSLLAKAFE